MADPVFIGVAVLTVGTAIIALEARELIYGAIALAISMLGIAGFYTSPAIDVTEIGEMMLTYYAPALIILGLTLAGSVIAALALARRENIAGEEEEEEEQGQRHHERTT